MVNLNVIMLGLMKSEKSWEDMIRQRESAKYSKLGET